MNKQQAQEQLDKLMIEAEKLKSIINNPDKTKEERFFELIQDLTPDWDKKIYPDSIFYFKGDKVWLDYNGKSGHLCIRYYGFYDVFEKEYGLNHQEIKDFLKDMLEGHFKWKGVTPYWLGLMNILQLEEHFKWKGVTPKYLYIKKT